MFSTDVVIVKHHLQCFITGQTHSVFALGASFHHLTVAHWLAIWRVALAVFELELLLAAIANLEIFAALGTAVYFATNNIACL